MGTLRRTKVELMGLVERVIAMYEEGCTLDKIEETLRSEGYDISRESIRLTLKKNKAIAKDLEKARQETKLLIDTIRSSPGADVNEATVDFLIAKAFDFVKKIEEASFEDLPEVAKFLRDLTRTKTDLVKLRMNYQQVYTRAKDDFMAELKKVIYDKNPDLYEQLFEIASHMEAPCE